MSEAFLASTAILVPFFGTVIGAACVLFIKGSLKPSIERSMLGFASGVMIAASVWSLLIPAIELSGTGAIGVFLSTVGGFMSGVVMLILFDRLFVRIKARISLQNGDSPLARSAMLIFAVTLHNFPEGMAVGVAVAGVMSGESDMGFMAAVSLSLGIAIQNIPEGAIISSPLRAGGMKRTRAFLFGAASGLAEPIGAAVTLWLTSVITPILPFILSLAAGAMFYAVVHELIPEAEQGSERALPTVSASVGFCIMMILDVLLG